MPSDAVVMQSSTGASNGENLQIDADMLAALLSQTDGVIAASETGGVAPATADNDVVVASTTTSRLPMPQAYVVAASYTLTPEALLQLPDSGLPTGTKILVAGLASADAINSGNCFYSAA